MLVSSSEVEEELQRINENKELEYIQFLRFLRKNEGAELYPYQEEAARLMFRAWEKSSIYD